MGLFDKLLGKTKVETNQDKPPSAASEYSTDIGVPLASDVAEFCDIAIKDKSCAILTTLSDFGQVWQTAFSYFSKHEAGIDAMKSISSPRAVCPKCTKEHTGTSLLGLTAAGSDLGMPRLRKCPQCSCTDVYYLFSPGHRI